MLGKLFKREHTNVTFLQEILHKEPNWEWLEEGLEKEIVDIDYVDKDGNTFLIKCLKVSKFKSAVWLINHHTDTTIRNNDNKTAINIAIERNNLIVVKELLDLKKIDVNQKDIDGRSLLQNVVVFGNHKMAKVLINYGADINNMDRHGRNILYDALSYGDQTFIQYLLGLKGIDLNFIDENGNTLMQHPEVVKDDAIAKDLLVAGIDSTIKDKNGESYLFQTALRGDEAEEIIDLALEYGADVNSKTAKENTIMMELIAASTKVGPDEQNRRKSLLKTSMKMLDFGGDINALDSNNETGLFNAIRLKDFELVSLLLSNDIDPNIQNNNDETALSMIALDGIKSLDLLLLLLTYDATPNLKNKKGQTLYEVLNNIILHNFGTKLIEDEKLLLHIDPHGQYISIVKELLAHNTEVLDYHNSIGEPLFFAPLLYEHSTLFKLYIKFGLDIHMVNKANHSIFFEYILKVFENDKSDSDTCEIFQSNISNLLASKVEKNYQDALGFTILHKIIGTNCNEKLFKILTKIVLFDYTLTDNLGRSVIHNAVWSNKPGIIKRIYSVAPTAFNIEDKYGVLPISYAALLGNKELVLLFIELGSNIGGSKDIALAAIKKFSPMLKNLQNLKTDVEDKSLLHKLDTVIDQVERDFKAK